MEHISVEEEGLDIITKKHPFPPNNITNKAWLVVYFSCKRSVYMYS